MTTAVPVVLFLFRRADTLVRVVDRLCEVSPELVIAIADGPRPDRPEEAAACAAAREIVARLDGVTRVIRLFSEDNLGCSGRIKSGLDWVFERFDAAIVLEDDILPEPSFFPWCARMLERYRDDPSVMHVSGRNNLGRWTLPGDGHTLRHRGSGWGWATWRRAWQRAVDFPGTPKDILRIAASSPVEPLVVDHVLMLQDLAITHRQGVWDTDWEIRKFLLGGLSVVPSANMVANIGFGPGATHTIFAGDIGATTPVWPAPPPAVADRCIDDARLDRWQLLVELMASYRQPGMVRRLARSAHLAGDAHWAGDRRLRHHLAPFAHPAEAVAALEHLCAVGGPAERLDDLIAVMRLASVEVAPPSEAGRPAAVGG